VNLDFGAINSVHGNPFASKSNIHDMAFGKSSGTDCALLCLNWRYPAHSKISLEETPRSWYSFGLKSNGSLFSSVPIDKTSEPVHHCSVFLLDGRIVAVQFRPEDQKALKLIGDSCLEMFAL
jgi:hypothetical protein